MFRIGEHEISINLHVLITTLYHVGYSGGRDGTVITYFSFNVTVEEKTNH